MPVKFTQFLRPDGRRKAVEIDLPEVVEKRAEQIINLGFEFEIEELSNGMVSATISDPQLGEDIAHAELVPNDERVVNAIINMIMFFDVETRIVGSLLEKIDI